MKTKSVTTKSVSRSDDEVTLLGTSDILPEHLDQNESTPIEEISNTLDDDNDESMEALINKALFKFTSSKFTSKAKACSGLHNRLINAGKLTKKNFRQSSNGSITKMNETKASVIEIAQQNSELYDKKTVVAPPLKPKKVKKPETVGKGWFEMQVILLFLLSYS